ncbi:ABC transporter ATP-binding protein [Actinopolymorpha sp. B11F2]|uniref:ABC transporter ATP-binding protein n=1 Tax=Actinopolymorpha sp. B11F2 TaxID=3160862 RepID=UPI0032E4EB58
MPPPLLEAIRTTQVFGRQPRHRNVALSDVSLRIAGDQPSFTAVVGESGSGKTTLARVLLGLQPPTSGEVRYRGTDLYKAGARQRDEFRRDVQAIFQDPFEVYNPFYKVDHLLTVPIRKFGLAKGRARMGELIEAALHDVGLRPEETLGRYPHQLSGGQRQRLTVARGLLIRPRLIIADEPVSMVDASLRKTILTTLRHLNEDYGISFVYITHDLATAQQVSENILVLYRGVVVEAGDAARVISQPQHPYTQLLVSSVPEPDPTRRWGLSQVPSQTDVTTFAGEDLPDADHSVAAAEAGLDGCAFADRCPHAMPMCTQSPPPLYHLHDHQAAACFLHRDIEATVEGDVSAAFRSPASQERVEDSRHTP